MATHPRGAGQPLDRDPTPQEQGTDILNDYHHKDMDNFENVGYETHTTLKALSIDLDDLQHRVETAKGKPLEAMNHLDCDLHRLSLMFCSSAPLEPLDDVLQQHTEILCSAQRQTTFANTLNQDITTFIGVTHWEIQVFQVNCVICGIRST